MNINRSFYYDSITEGWTKKDWALNLLPLGGVASVAYEIGSACLCARDQTAKISQDFFKSPIQTTFKKIAQCLWVPIVICGALKLVYPIVTACWDRCFHPEVTEKEKRDRELIAECESVRREIKEIKSNIQKLDQFISSYPDLLAITQEHIVKYKDYIAIIPTNIAAIQLEGPHDYIGQKGQLCQKRARLEHELKERIRFIKNHGAVYACFEAHFKAERDRQQSTKENHSSTDGQKADLLLIIQSGEN